ncbi:hypothetical protein EHZ13_01325 [Clostridium perfringens]|uniref:hypothetical protein n=1 Tax=Clostridium TaxID=1485 RepID=UPI00019AFF04|nr:MULTISPECIES: hypothetical protein [Clostridium]EEH97081.1 hypothetical protein CSBG_00707 [Clostridium sp. 7_2_43FAA]MDK3119939.1 hypothetical protein [Clostridium perfringens]MDM0793839.1 hypothetical protein [Clostridium perfringens]MDU7241232.1 hypothetical protein [Clostridium sp.]RQN14664.1 hypothetical protein EHZ13_01325 [Clostridium perfringens]
MAKGKYTSKESLNPIKNIISKAGEMTSTEAVISKNDKGLSEVLAAAAGMGAGAAGSFAALGALGIAGYSAVGITTGLATAGGIVGGGMVAGIGVLAAPIAVLGVGGYALVANKKKKELLVEKKALLQEAIRKQNIIIDKLKNKVQLQEEKARELESMNIILTGIINDLKGDIAVA